MERRVKEDEEVYTDKFSSSARLICSQVSRVEDLGFWRVAMTCINEQDTCTGHSTLFVPLYAQSINHWMLTNCHLR